MRAPYLCGRMTQWRALSDADVVELAARLRSLDCTWELGQRQVRGGRGPTGRRSPSRSCAAHWRGGLPADRGGGVGGRPQDTVHGHNWWAELPWPSPSDAYRELAGMVVTGLRDSLRITGPQVLVHEAWDGRRGNRALALPLLGLNPKS